MKKINITEVRHDRIPKVFCGLKHTRHTADLISHFLQEYAPLFEMMDVILIEQQPPKGLKDIETLLYSHFRGKAVLCHPTSMHTFYGMTGFTYEERKVLSENIAVNEIVRFCPSLQKEINSYERKHDITDSILFLHKYFLETPLFDGPVEKTFETEICLDESEFSPIPFIS